jgi:hypothetical protein
MEYDVPWGDDEFFSYYILKDPIPYLSQPLFGDDHIYVAGAPAGGATAAAPEGGALASPSASPHLPVVGAGNPVAVPGLARWGAKRADSSIRGICSCRESHVHRAFEKIISVQYRRQDLPLGPSDMFFRVHILLNTALLRGVGPALRQRLMARRVRPDQLWEAGVGAGGGQPGSSAKKGRSLAVDQPCASRTLPRGEVRHGTCRWLVAVRLGIK